MSGTSGCRVQLPGGMGIEYFIDGILDSKYGDKTLFDLIEDYEQAHHVTLLDPTGADAEKAKQKFRYLSSRYWDKDGTGRNKLDKVLLDIPSSVLQQMFPGAPTSSNNWLTFLQTSEYDKAGNPVMETITEFNDKGEKIQTQRPKTSVWRIEYDLHDRWGKGSRVLNDETWKAIWGKMVDGLVEQFQGGMAQHIVAAHNENHSKVPGMGKSTAKVGKTVREQTLPSGRKGKVFEIRVTNEYTPQEQQSGIGVSLEGPQTGTEQDFTPNI